MSNTSITGVAFDLEGTLIDLEQAHWQGHLDAAAQAGLPLTLEQGMALLPHWVGGPDEKVAEDIAAQLGAPHRSEEILRASKRAFLRYLEQGANIAPRPGVFEFLEYLRRRNLSYCIGSLTDRVLGWHLLRVSGLDEWFVPQRVVFKEDVARLKPAPDVYWKTANYLGIAPQQQLVFEDSAIGVRAAVAAGSVTVAVPVIKTTSFIEKLQDAGAVLVLDGWDQRHDIVPLIESSQAVVVKQF